MTEHASVFAADDVSDLVFRFFRRCDAAKNCGGIGMNEVACGKEVPEGWWLDDITLYWIPPSVRLI